MKIQPPADDLELTMKKKENFLQKGDKTIHSQLNDQTENKAFAV